MSRKQRYCKVSEECVRGARFFFFVSFGREIAQSGVEIAHSQSKAAQSLPKSLNFKQMSLNLAITHHPKC